MSILTLSTPAGYELRHRMRGPFEVIIEAWKDGVEVASIATQESDRHPGYIQIRHTQIPEAHRKQGLGPRMYVEAERRTGKKLVRNRDMSAAAERMWNRPDRPFGVDLPEPADERDDSASFNGLRRRRRKR